MYLHFKREILGTHASALRISGTQMEPRQRPLPHWEDGCQDEFAFYVRVWPKVFLSDSAFRFFFHKNIRRQVLSFLFSRRGKRGPEPSRSLAAPTANRWLRRTEHSTSRLPLATGATLDLRLLR